MNVYIHNGRLPSAYQEVEYIENSGTQYINTGVYPNPDYTTEVKFQNVSFSTYNSFFGCRDGSNSRYYARNDIYDYVWVNRSYSTNSGYEKYTASTPRDYNVHTFKLSRYLYIDGTLVKTFSATQSSTTFPYSIYLFCISSEGTAADFMMGKIFYCKIWNDSGTLIRDMIPCYRKSDNVIGMYDLVNNTFYTNAGSGTFTKGSNVNSNELKNAYIGGYPPLVLQQIFDFTTNDWKGFTMTPTNGAGLVIDTSGHYCRGPRNNTYSTHGNGTVWKTINATRYWGRIKCTFAQQRGSGVCVGVYNVSGVTSGGANFAMAPGYNTIEINVNDTNIASESYTPSANTYYYVDGKFENGLYTITVYDSNMNLLKTLSVQTSDTICKYAGFSMWGYGYDTVNSNFKIYEYREAYDNN